MPQRFVPQIGRQAVLRRRRSTGIRSARKSAHTTTRNTNSPSVNPALPRLSISSFPREKSHGPSLRARFTPLTASILFLVRAPRIIACFDRSHKMIRIVLAPCAACPFFGHVEASSQRYTARKNSGRRVRGTPHFQAGSVTCVSGGASPLSREYLPIRPIPTVGCRQGGRGGFGGFVRGLVGGARRRFCRGRPRGECRGPSCRERPRDACSGDIPTILR